MKEQLRQHLLTQYPAWHEQPLRLTIPEMEDPFSVLTFFFDCYTLPDIRTCLEELLNDSLRAEGVEASDHVSTHGDIEKLVEAVWIIHQQARNGTKQKNQELTPDQNEQGVADIENEELIVCYQSIHDFFDSFTLPFARSYLLSALKAAESTHIWNKRAPTDLLYFFESLEALLPAVFSIAKSGDKVKKVSLPKSTDTPNLTKCHLYCGTYDQHESWDYFPRSLSAKEYCDPYKALQKFTAWASKKEWKEILQYILSYALGANSLSELGVNLELVRISELLQKMLDACHLIDVRISIQKNDIKQTDN